MVHQDRGRCKINPAIFDSKIAVDQMMEPFTY